LYFTTGRTNLKKPIRGAALLCLSLLMSTAYAQTAQPIPAWDHVIAGAARFEVLRDFGNDAVLDHETGLVWERAPDTSATYPYYLAAQYCLNLSLGGRKGWRVPSIFELSTLLDTTIAPPAPLLPAGHPFRNVSKFLWFWSSTHDTNVMPLQWGLNTMNGTVLMYFPTTAGMHAWCVRAPSAESRH
jgi:hypothetical protein